MPYLTNALAAADAIQSRIESELKKPKGKQLSPEEAYRSKVEKAKARLNPFQRRRALKNLEKTISIVNKALADLKTCKKTSQAKSPEKPSTNIPNGVPNGPTHDDHGQHGLDDKAKPSLALSEQVATTGEDTQTLINNLTTTMSANKDTGLGSVQPTLSDMASSIEPIVSKFDSVLSKPYLDQYSATLNTVPVVGLKGQSIMYVQTKPDNNPLGTTVDVWSLFGSLPDGVDVGSQKVHFFPYKGDFCLSVGKSVWRKQHRQGNDQDPELQQAKDNWPKMYLDDWEQVGLTALPDDDLLDIVPFSVLSADRTQIGFQLVILGADSSIRLLTSDSLTANNDWTSMSYKQAGNSPAGVPKRTRISYWNGQIVAIDNAWNSWNIAPDFGAHTYTISDQAQIAPISEFTASDVGPIGVQADGYLWRRIVVPPPSTDDDPTQEWTQWIKQDGVTNLGIASPGVILDLQTLTRTLRAQYIDTQTALYPVMNKIKAFSTTHKFYLTQLQQAAQDYANADGDDQKQELAIKNGKGYVVHAKTWATILNTSSNNAKTTVNIMAGELLDVKSQLEVQLQILKDKLAALQATLSAQESALSKLQAAFWGSVAAMLLGLAVAVIGAATAQPWVLALAGALFVGGLVATITLASKMGDLSSSISSTNSQISTVQEGISELTFVTNSFGDLAQFYLTLNTFWGRMTNDSVVLATMDDATAAQLGEDILVDTSSIDAAIPVTDGITDGCTTYLDTLNKQGITIPTSNTLFAATQAGKGQTNLVKQLHKKEKSLSDSIAKATKQISAGHLKNYHETMKKAVVLHFAALNAQAQVTAAVGTWFDVPSLKSNGSIWSGYSNSIGMDSLSKTSSSELIEVGSSINGDMEDARVHVVALLEKTVQLTSIVQSWAEKFPSKPPKDQMDAVEELKDQAVSACQQAQTAAAQANNAFTDFNHEATTFQQHLEAQAAQLNDQKSSTSANAKAQESNISIPWYVYLNGPAAVLIYEEVQRESIENNLRDTLNGLDNSIQALNNAMSSGLTYNGETLPWIKMVQDVSGSLGAVYNILTGVEGQLLEDPNLYTDLLHMEWEKIQTNANEVLQILQVHAPISLKATLQHKTAQGQFGASDDGKTTVVNALSPSDDLGTNLSDQAAKAKDTLGDLNTLLTLPVANDIILTWDEGNTQRTTLLDVATKLHRDYVQMLASQYKSVEQVYVLSILQATRASNAASGKLSLQLFTSGTLQAVQASFLAASNTRTAYGQSAAQFDSLMEQINDNITTLQTRIQAIDSQIDNLDIQLRDKIMWEVADCIAIAFSVGIIIASLGAASPAVAALSLAARLSLAAGATAASVKLALDSLSLDELTTTIGALKQSSKELKQGLANLQAVQPLFRAVVDGVNGNADTLNQMNNDISTVNSDSALLARTTLTTDDATKISAAWSNVQSDCLSWLDFVNSQGIVPTVS